MLRQHSAVVLALSPAAISAPRRRHFFSDKARSGSPRRALSFSQAYKLRERGADERRNDNVTSTRSNCSRIHAGIPGITNSSADIYPLRPRHRFGNNHVRTLDLQCKCIGKRHAYFSADRHPINFRKPCLRRIIASKWALERKTSHNIHGRTHNRIHDCTRSVSRHDCRQLE